MGVVSSPLPAETSADVASCFDCVQGCPPHASAVAKAIAKAAVGSRGDRQQQGGTRYGYEIWSGGNYFSAVQSGWTAFKGDCPWRDSLTCQEFLTVLSKFNRCDVCVKLPSVH